jgi:hypothetical protein
MQLLMRICELLKATPNDLLCDTIGAPPVLEAQPYGFADAARSTYQAEPASVATRQEPKSGEASGDERKAVAWQLAEAIAQIQAREQHGCADNLPTIERLRLIGPLFARLDADPFTFLANLPAELGGLGVTAADEKRIGDLSEKLIELNGS